MRLGAAVKKTIRFQPYKKARPGASAVAGPEISDSPHAYFTPRIVSGGSYCTGQCPESFWTAVAPRSKG